MGVVDTSLQSIAEKPKHSSTDLPSICKALQTIQLPKKRAEYLLSCFSCKESALEEYCKNQNEDDYFYLLLIELLFLYPHFDQSIPSLEKLALQAKKLKGAHRFYYEQGGLLYYQSELLHQLQTDLSPLSLDLYPPSPIVVEKLSVATKNRWIQNFYDHFPEYAEFYPIGGAADRLNSSLDPETAPLPAAKLSFCKEFLLEKLFADLRAKEQMYTKLTGKRVDVPVVLMTSQEQKNHTLIQELLETSNYFGKDKTKIKIISQPLVPASDDAGKWIFLKDDQVMLRPAGHGIFWQLLAKEGVLEWLFSQNCKRALIRQINNPIAGLDDLLTLLVGAGIENEKEFGFASTYFDLTYGKAVQEGCNVVMRKEREGKSVYALSNLEYTHPEFAKESQQDGQKNRKRDWYQIANANLLYVNLEKGKEKIESFVPPPYINRKKTNLEKEGAVEEKVVIRLETTIQSISEMFTCEKPETIADVPHEHLPTFLLLQKRSKTLSAIKKIGSGTCERGFEKDSPELCLSHFQKEAGELLTKAGIEVPTVENEIEGFPYIFLYTPELGPYYEVILQKLRKGTLEIGSEFLCGFGEVDIENLHLQGSFSIYPSKTSNPSLGFAKIHNSQILNKGLDCPVISPLYWKGEMVRKEEVTIELGYRSELDMEGVLLLGSHHFIVPDHHRLILRQEGAELVSRMERIQNPWFWNYRLEKEGFLLKKEETQVE